MNPSATANVNWINDHWIQFTCFSLQCVVPLKSVYIICTVEMFELIHVALLIFADDVASIGDERFVFKLFSSTEQCFNQNRLVSVHQILMPGKNLVRFSLGNSMKKAVHTRYGWVLCSSKQQLSDFMSTMVISDVSSVVGRYLPCYLTIRDRSSGYFCREAGRRVPFWLDSMVKRLTCKFKNYPNWPRITTINELLACQSSIVIWESFRLIAFLLSTALVTRQWNIVANVTAVITSSDDPNMV